MAEKRNQRRWKRLRGYSFRWGGSDYKPSDHGKYLEKGKEVDWKFTPVDGILYLFDYNRTLDNIYRQSLKKKRKRERWEYLRARFQWLCTHDLFFLLYFGLGRKDLNRGKAAKFFVERCFEVQSSHNRTLDLWAREHGKSSVITIGLTIMHILRDPSSATGIFSHNRPMAKDFLRAIRSGLETRTLTDWWPDVLYKNPAAEADSWGLDSGLIVRRGKDTIDRPEATVSAWGLVDAMPVGKHFDHRVYDDVVDQTTVGTKEQMEKAWDAFQQSHSLGRREVGTCRIAGTRYHFGDPYGRMIEQGSWNVRIQTVYGGNNTEGDPVVFTQEELDQRIKDLGPYNSACQLFLSPVPPGEQRLKLEWIDYYELAPLGGMNVYIVCDPANEKKKSRNHDPDYTVMWVVGFDSRGYVYLLDGVRQRLNLEERWQVLRAFVKKWNPMCVGWERYGKDSDVQHFEYRMKQENFRFRLVELGGSTSKIDRIQRLVPLMSQKKILVPKDGIMQVNREENKRENLVDLLLDEMRTWPYSVHDDMLDALSRIEDRDVLGVVEPYDESDAMRQIGEEMREEICEELPL